MRLALDPEERRARASAVRGRFEAISRSWEQVATRYLELLEQLHAR